MNFLNTAAYAGNILSAKQAADAKASELALEQQKVGMVRQDLQTQQQYEQMATDPSIAGFLNDGTPPGAQPMPQGVSAAPPSVASGGPSVPTPMPQGAMGGAPTPAYGPNGAPVPGQAPPPRQTSPQGAPAGPPTATPMQGPQTPQQPPQAPQQPQSPASQQLLQTIKQKYPYASPAAVTKIMQQFTAAQGQRQELALKHQETEEKLADSRSAHDQQYDARMSQIQSEAEYHQSMAEARSLAAASAKETADFHRQMEEDKAAGKKIDDSRKKDQAIYGVLGKQLHDANADLEKFIKDNGGSPPAAPSHSAIRGGADYTPEEMAKNASDPAVQKYQQYQSLVNNQKMLSATTQHQQDKLMGLAGDDEPAPAAGPAPAGNPAPSLGGAGGQVKVTDPSGKVFMLPAAQLQDALAQGYKQAQ